MDPPPPPLTASEVASRESQVTGRRSQVAGHRTSPPVRALSSCVAEGPATKEPGSEREPTRRHRTCLRRVEVDNAFCLLSPVPPLSPATESQAISPQRERIQKAHCSANRDRSAPAGRKPPKRLGEQPDTLRQPSWRLNDPRRDSIHGRVPHPSAPRQPNPIA
jgi:hypothetical protein